MLSQIDLHSENGYALAVATFGENLRAVRETRGLTQEKLAELLGHKRPGVVQSWEKNRRRPREKAIKALADHLHCTPAMLLKGVPGDYDTLRDETTDTEGIGAGMHLTRTEKRVLRLLRGMNEEGQRLAADAIAGMVKAFPLPLSPASSAPIDQRLSGRVRKVRGIR